MRIDWDSHMGTYRHTCDSCGIEFHGRKNRQYCTEKCKARHNNELAAVRKKKAEKLVHAEREANEILIALSAL